MTKEQLSKLIPGDWINTIYGYDRHDWCVLNNYPDQEAVAICMPGWLTSSTKTIRYSSLLGDNYDTIFVGHTKKRWWRFLTLMFYDCTFPYAMLR